MIVYYDFDDFFRRKMNFIQHIRCIVEEKRDITDIIFSSEILCD